MSKKETVTTSTTGGGVERHQSTRTVGPSNDQTTTTYGDKTTTTTHGAKESQSQEYTTMSPEGQLMFDREAADIDRRNSIGPDGRFNGDQGTLTAALGINPELYKQEQERRAKLAAFKRKEAGWRDALAVVSDVVSTAAGGNVYLREPNKVAAENAAIENEARSNVDKLPELMNQAARSLEAKAAAEKQAAHDRLMKLYGVKVKSGYEQQGDDQSRTVQAPTISNRSNSGYTTTESGTRTLPTRTTQTHTVVTGDGVGGGSGSGGGNKDAHVRVWNPKTGKYQAVEVTKQVQEEFGRTYANEYQQIIDGNGGPDGGGKGQELYNTLKRNGLCSRAVNSMGEETGPIKWDYAAIAQADVRPAASAETNQYAGDLIGLRLHNGNPRNSSHAAQKGKEDLR